MQQTTVRNKLTTKSKKIIQNSTKIESEFARTTYQFYSNLFICLNVGTCKEKKTPNYIQNQANKQKKNRKKGEKCNKPK